MKRPSMDKSFALEKPRRPQGRGRDEGIWALAPKIAPRWESRKNRPVEGTVKNKPSPGVSHI